MSSKVAIVTGSNKGLGLAIVRELCERNYGVVYLTSRDEIRGREACEKLIQTGLKPTFHRLDVTDQDSVNTFAGYIKKQHGSVDLLINNAGLLFLPDAKEAMTYQAEQTLSVNLFSLINFTEAMLPVIKNEGAILNMSSSAGHLCRIPSEGLREKLQENLDVEDIKSLFRSYLDDVRSGKTEVWGASPYVVSKVGVNAYTLNLHRRLANRDISVNSYHPGYVITDMTRGVGTVTPEVAAKGAVTLAFGGTNGPRGKYVWHNGKAVPWDGPDPRVYIDGKKF